MKKAIAVKNSQGHYEAVYLTDTDDMVIKETTFSGEEWSRGVPKWQWENAISTELGKDYQVVGKEMEDLGNGFLYRLFFVKRDKFMRKPVSKIVEEYIIRWEASDE